MNSLELDEDSRNVFKQRLFRFRRSHTLYVLFLASIALLQFIAIAFFAKGFLLTRNVLNDISILKPSQFNNDYNKKFDKTVILILDALRFDFVIPIDESEGNFNGNYHNNLKTLYDHFQQNGSKDSYSSLLLKFLADPPTTTLQRLKGLTTGSLPTFIDAGSNFDGSVIEEDNLIKQMFLNNQKVYFVGDDTWDALFNPFLSNYSDPFESLNVWDLDTVDQGVMSYFDKHLISPKDKNAEKWDVLIGHMLGIDHVGHKYGPNHFTMREKQLQANKFIEDIIESIDDNTLLVIMGDHGMDHTGNHGGDSQDELESTLFLFTKQKNAWNLKDDGLYDVKNLGKSYRSVNQIDLVPTLSLLLDLPIPFNNLGWPIEEIAKSNLDKELFAKMTLEQLKNYQEVNGLVTEGSERYVNLHDLYEDATMDVSHATIYQAQLLELCKDLWARFDYWSIAIGIIFLFISLVILIAVTKLIPSIVISQMIPKFVPLIMMMILVSNLCLHSLFYVFQPPSFIDTTFWCSLLATSIGISIGCIAQIIERYSLKWLVFRFIGELSDYWSRIGTFILIIHGLLFTSNSFTIWEDKIVSFLLISIGVLTFYEFVFVPKRQSTCALLRNENNEDISIDKRTSEYGYDEETLPLTKASRYLGAYHSVVLIVCTRLASSITICREEQGDSCAPTFTTSNNYSQATMAISLLLMVFTPSCIKGYYQISSSYQGAAPIWVNKFLRAFLLINFTFWGITTLENILENSTLDLSILKFTISRSLLGFSLIALNVGWSMGPLCIDFGIDEKREARENTATMLGFKNIYGSQYFLLVINIFMSIMVFSKPMAQISLYLMISQILSIMEIIDLFKLKENIIGPFALSLLSYQQFFSTGHQATIPSVQWDAGFILAEKITFPFTHIAIFLNTFGPHILVAVSVALITLWQQPPAVLKPQTLLGRIASNGGTLIVYNTVLCLSSFIWVTHFRRHLMVWKIFCPRFLFACMSLIVTQLVVTFITIAFASGRLIRQINKLFWE